MSGVIRHACGCVFERRGHRLVRVVACGGARANRTREAQARQGRPRRAARGA